jgi:polar amino acid transport system substrate-binding protein
MIRTPHAAALALLALAACQSAPPRPAASAPGRIDRILANGELRVGLSAAQPPFNMKNRRGEVVGLDVDIVRALADAMGVKLRLVERPFAELLPGLEKGDVDLVISGVTITPERNARVAFAGPYFISGKAVLSKSEAIAGAADVAALDASGRTYVALAGSTSESFVKSSMPRARLVTAPDYDTAVRMVIDGHADGLVADLMICMLSVWRNPNAGLSASKMSLTAEPLGIALPADDPLFVNLVQNYLTTLEYTGLLTQFKARWLNDGSWVPELP